MSAKLIIDMTKADLQMDSQIQCSYKHHPGNRGFDALLEMVRFALICRRCQSAPCVKACPRGALEKAPSATHDAGVLKRANMLCTGCGTCAMACPFGTVYTDLIPFPSSVCDGCRDRLGSDEKPLCVQTCPDGEVEYRSVKVNGGLVEVFDNIVAKVPEGQMWEPFRKDKQGAER